MVICVGVTLYFYATSKINVVFYFTTLVCVVVVLQIKISHAKEETVFLEL